MSTWPLFGASERHHLSPLSSVRPKTREPRREGQDVKTDPGASLWECASRPVPRFPHPEKEANDEKLAVTSLLDQQAERFVTPGRTHGTCKLAAADFFFFFLWWLLRQPPRKPSPAQKPWKGVPGAVEADRASLRRGGLSRTSGCFWRKQVSRVGQLKALISRSLTFGAPWRPRGLRA